MVPVALAAGPIIDHNCTDLSLIPAQWIEQAKNDLQNGGQMGDVMLPV